MQPRFRLMCVIITQPRTQHLRIKLATLENLLFKPNNWFAQGIGTVDTNLIVFFLNTLKNQYTFTFCKDRAGIFYI